MQAAKRKAPFSSRLESRLGYDKIFDFSHYLFSPVVHIAMEFSDYYYVSMSFFGMDSSSKFLFTDPVTGL